MRKLILIAAAVLIFLAPSAARAQVYGNANALVDYWYRTYFGRPAELAAGGWVKALNAGTSPDRVLAAILGSDEYYLRAGGTPDRFITRLYLDNLRRLPTPGELNFWVRRMYTEDRASIADELLLQNPGVWVSSNPGVVSPVPTGPAFVTPRIDRWQRGWSRDRNLDWDRHHDIHEYRRPAIPFYGAERHERYR